MKLVLGGGGDLDGAVHHRVHRAVDQAVRWAVSHPAGGRVQAGTKVGLVQPGCVCFYQLGKSLNEIKVMFTCS